MKAPAQNLELTEAARLGNQESVERLLAQGADALGENSFALRLAAGSGHSGCVRLLLPVSDAKANGSHALQWAAKGGHAECVRLLIPVSDAKADNSGAMRFAAKKGHSECVKLLLPRSNSAAKNSQALQWAAKGGHEECVRLLLPVSEAKKMDSNALRWGVENGHVECVKLLIPASQPPTASNMESALARGDANIVMLLHSCEPRLLDAMDLSRKMAAAIEKNHAELAELLSSIIDQRELSRLLKSEPLGGRAQRSRL